MSNFTGLSSNKFNMRVLKEKVINQLHYLVIAPKFESFGFTAFTLSIACLTSNSKSILSYPWSRTQFIEVKRPRASPTITSVQGENHYVRATTKWCLIQTPIPTLFWVKDASLLHFRQPINDLLHLVTPVEELLICCNIGQRPTFSDNQYSLDTEGINDNYFLHHPYNRHS